MARTGHDKQENGQHYPVTGFPRGETGEVVAEPATYLFSLRHCSTSKTTADAGREPTHIAPTQRETNTSSREPSPTASANSPLNTIADSTVRLMQKRETIRPH